MKVSVILAHPRMGSFNHAIANTVLNTLRENRHEVYYYDLYAENFNPVLPVEEIPKDALIPLDILTHCNEIAGADGIVIVHPNWWGQPPAILKGWIDRVIRPGVAYEFLEGDSGEGVPDGLLKAKTAIVFNTADTPEEREKQVFGDPLESIWKACIFDFCGIKNFHRKTYGVMVTSSLEQRQSWLRDVKKIIERYFPK
ncbi:NAD(P)H-dependent oxidoreductase [Candidatus Contubernalis alkaliaceticus]|uniref:NAD(P)H-dependent oxidoreductase n=1 Tax=Candidatus Contubernalis alkaliaceticus TaxID=338645 RepID=UPI001F4BD875|nr:NAD(P)H-dependent oxidoreductase [Candidatus Contubernalis alkalaceticus]UNC91188.1 NAD(P)H-dependent oxidoreductase [Candidatus Contubernalis alkalaceticus]